MIRVQFQNALRGRSGWHAFFNRRDRFIQELSTSRTQGFRIGEYRAPTGSHIPFHLVADDLSRHGLVLGGTGSGKSVLLENLARSHFDAGRSVVLIDLHGDLFRRTAAWAISAGVQNLLLLDFTRPDLLPSWNPLAPTPGVDPGRQVDHLVGVLRRIVASDQASAWTWGPATEQIFRYGLRAAIESPIPCTLIDLPAFLAIPGLRTRLAASASSETRSYFQHQFTRRDEGYVSSVANRLQPLVGSTAAQRFLGVPDGTLDLPSFLDGGGTILVNLSKGYLGPGAEMLGRLLVNFIELTAFRRHDKPLAKRKPFSLLLDEAHGLTGSDSGFENLLIGGRKFGVSMTLASQSLSLFPADSRAILLGNTALHWIFRLPHADARQLAPDLLEPLGSVQRQRVRPYDSLEDPLLTPSEEIAARTRELSNLPVGACYWHCRGKDFRGRRLQLDPPSPLPISEGRLDREIDSAMARFRSSVGTTERPAPRAPQSESTATSNSTNDGKP